jgi:hypothetical protein
VGEETPVKPSWHPIGYIRGDEDAKALGGQPFRRAPVARGAVDKRAQRNAGDGEANQQRAQPPLQPAATDLRPSEISSGFHVGKYRLPQNSREAQSNKWHIQKCPFCHQL